MSSPNVWATEPPEDHAPMRLHADIAESLRRRPGVWRLIGTYAFRGGATNSASVIRRGGAQAWRRRPGGYYEAKAVTTQGGEHQVYARWVLAPVQQRSAA